MSPKIISIPSLADASEDFERLFTLSRDLQDEMGSTVLFDFSKCKFLRPNAIAFLGGLARLLELRKNRPVFDVESLDDVVTKANLYSSGFPGSAKQLSYEKNECSIPYREDPVLNINGIMDYLSDLWLGKGWVHVTPLVRNAIVGNVWEIYNNAFEHSGSEIGVFTCGEYLKEKNSLLLSVVDFGHGIASKIRDFFIKRDLRAKTLTDARCLMWAFESGNTTCVAGVPRGLGLDLLKEFIQLNEGKLEVYCNEGYGIVDKRGKRFEGRTVPFSGTMVHITLRCDESLYQFKHETNPLFL